MEDLWRSFATSCAARSGGAPPGSGADAPVAYPFSPKRVGGDLCRPARTSRMSLKLNGGADICRTELTASPVMMTTPALRSRPAFLARADSAPMLLSLDGSAGFSGLGSESPLRKSRGHRGMTLAESGSQSILASTAAGGLSPDRRRRRQSVHGATLGSPLRAKSLLSSPKAGTSSSALARSRHGSALSGRSATAPAGGAAAARGDGGGEDDPDDEVARALRALAAETAEDPNLPPKELAAPFTACGSLFELLKGKVVALLNAQWLVDFAEGPTAGPANSEESSSPAAEFDASAPSAEARRPRRLPRRQDVPAHAFVRAEDLFELTRTGTRELRSGHQIVAISHCWLSPTHPDPEGTQLEKLARYLKDWANTTPGLLLQRIAVFVDWCSIMQEPRTPAESALFDQSLQQAHIWYAHRLVHVWQLTVTPKMAAAYRARGWTHFEAALANLNAHWGGDVLDMGRCETGARHLERGWPFSGAGMSALMQATSSALDAAGFGMCRVPRGPPITPKRFAKSLDGKVFSNPKDEQLLIRLYTEFFEAFASYMEKLDFSGLEWGDLDLEKVADALPSFCRLKELNLANNEITEIGAGFLAEEICACPSLSKLFLTDNEVLPGLEGSERLKESWAAAKKEEFWLLLSFPTHSDYVRRKAGLD